MTKVRCVACRGAKQVMKLGCVMGNCGLCKGIGEIDECDVPVMIKAAEAVNVVNIIKQVEQAVPVEAEELKVPSDVDVKVDGKRAIYKRKTIGK
jgi:hypothetical protein